MRELLITIDDAKKGKQQTALRLKDLLVVGYGGRDLEKTLEHIRELERIGVAPPPTIPMIYRVDVSNLSCENRIILESDETSGEAEYILCHNGEEWLVSVGSDHTDRALEKEDVQKSKEVCPKPISTTFWRFADVEEHWDQLVLRSWVTDVHGRRKYQDHDLTALLPVRDLINKLHELGYHELSHTLIFSGTVPTLEGFVYGNHFEYELYDPLLNRSIKGEYSIQVKGR